MNNDSSSNDLSVRSAIILTEFLLAQYVNRRSHKIEILSDINKSK